MTPRLFRLWVLAVAAGACLPVFAQEPQDAAPASESSDAAQPGDVAPAAPAEAPEEMLRLTLSDAPLELVLQRLEDMTGRTILRPQALPTPTISINITRPIPKSEAIRALETLLNLNQIALTPMGDKFLKVVPLPMVRNEAPEMIDGSTLELPPSGQVMTKLFQLDFLRVNEFLPQINPLLNPNLGGPVIFEKTNAALITDSVSTLQRIELLIAKLDQPAMGSLTPKFYPVRYAKASDVANKLRIVLQGPVQTQLASTTTYSADDRTNQIVVLADPRQHAFFDDLIAKLDVKSDPNTRNEVIFLKHAASKDVATLLSQLVSGQNKAMQNDGGGGNATPRPGQPPLPGQQPAASPEAIAALGDLPGSAEFSSLVTVIPDERSNAVVVSGTVEDIRLIRELVDKLDVLLAQVRIEVVIAEVLLSDNATSGINALGLVVQGNKLVGFSASAPGISIGGAATKDGTSGFATLKGYDLSAIINLTTTPRKRNTTIVSVPSISTMHNKEGKIFFGETRPVITGSITTPTVGTGQTTSSTVTQQEIGTTVTVKPLIGYDGTVQLDIKQDISDVAGTVTVDGNQQYIIGKRSTASFVTVKSGEIIVLGGMQKRSSSRETNRLGPIPFIGDFFGTRQRGDDRTELVFFLRPLVLTNTPADNAAALQQLEAMPTKEIVKKALEPVTPDQPRVFEKGLPQK